MRSDSRPTTGQFARFVFVGFIQYALDFILFTLLFTLVYASPLFNMVSRLLAATAGYHLNRRFTFGRPGRARQAGQAIRFVLLWLLLTGLGTLLLDWVQAMGSASGHATRAVLAAKLIIEAIFVILSFLAQKYWVFAPRHE